MLIQYLLSWRSFCLSAAASVCNCPSLLLRCQFTLMPFICNMHLHCFTTPFTTTLFVLLALALLSMAQFLLTGKYLCKCRKYQHSFSNCKHLYLIVCKVLNETHITAVVYFLKSNTGVKNLNLTNMCKLTFYCNNSMLYSFSISFNCFTVNISYTATQCLSSHIYLFALVLKIIF